MTINADIPRLLLISMEFFGYLALICIGIILSLLGGGGSLLAVPILVYLFSLDIVTASSYSLFIVGTTSLVGALLKQKEQQADLRCGMIFSTSSVVAIFATRKWIIPSIPEEVMLLNMLIAKRALILGVFAILLITASLMILLRRTLHSTDGGKQRLKILLPVSFTTGILVGFVGVGGGFLIVPSLTVFARLPFKIAVGTTLLIIGLSSLIGFVGDVMNYPIDWLFLLMITGLATAGMLLGSIYSPKIPIRYLRLSFGGIMLITAVLILIKESMPHFTHP
jgi:uncharacterized membrane protein YfcA